MSNPNQESKPLNEDEDQSDAAALFEQLSSKDSNDSKQGDDDNTLDKADDVLSNDDAGESNHDNGGQGQADDDPWSQVDESLRNQHYTLQANYSKLSNDHKANSGRVQALNNKVQELTSLTKANELNGKPTGNGPTAEELEGKTFDEVEEEWPEIAGYLKRHLEQSQQSIAAQIKEQLNPLNEMRERQQQHEQQQRVRSELDRLQQIHPDYREVSQDSKFHSWVNNQPESVRSMARSLDAADNIVLLNLYKGENKIGSSRNKSNLSDYAVIPKKGNGRRVQADPNSIDPVALFNQLAPRK